MAKREDSPQWQGVINRTAKKLYGADKRHNYIYMDGRVPLSELLEFVDDSAHGMDYADIWLNWTSLVWIDDATPEEIEAARKRDEFNVARREEYERKTLRELTEKYGSPEAG